MAAELSTKQTFQILENLEATHLSGAYGPNGEGILFPTNWALARIRELGEDGNRTADSGNPVTPMTQQQAENLAETLHEMEATMEDFNKIKRMATPTLGSRQQPADKGAQSSGAAVDAPEEIQHQCDAAVEDLAKILTEAEAAGEWVDYGKTTVTDNFAKILQEAEASGEWVNYDKLREAFNKDGPCLLGTALLADKASSSTAGTLQQPAKDTHSPATTPRPLRAHRFEAIAAANAEAGTLQQPAAQTLPGPDQFQVRRVLMVTYWTTGSWTGRKDKMEIWIKESVSENRSTAMLGLPRLRRPITEGEKLLDQGTGLHITLAYIEPAISPPQLLEDALGFRLEEFTENFADQNVTIEFDPSDCDNMLLVRQSEGVNSIFRLVHNLRCWILRYAELPWHIKNYVPGRQAWHYVAEAVQHQRRAVLTGIHMSTKGIGTMQEEDEMIEAPNAARKTALEKAAKAETKGSKLFIGTSLDAAPKKLQRNQVRSRSC